MKYTFPAKAKYKICCFVYLCLLHGVDYYLVLYGD